MKKLLWLFFLAKKVNSIQFNSIFCIYSIHFCSIENSFLLFNSIFRRKPSDFASMFRKDCASCSPGVAQDIQYQCIWCRTYEKHQSTRTRDCSKIYFLLLEHDIFDLYFDIAYFRPKSATPNLKRELSGRAPGDVLLMRGSGRISDIGNAGGFMGHVLVVTLYRSSQVSKVTKWNYRFKRELRYRFHI